MFALTVASGNYRTAGAGFKCPLRSVVSMADELKTPGSLLAEYAGVEPASRQFEELFAFDPLDAPRNRMMVPVDALPDQQLEGYLSYYRSIYRNWKAGNDLALEWGRMMAETFVDAKPERPGSFEWRATGNQMDGWMRARGDDPIIGMHEASDKAFVVALLNGGFDPERAAEMRFVFSLHPGFVSRAFEAGLDLAKVDAPAPVKASLFRDTIIDGKVTGTGFPGDFLDLLEGESGDAGWEMRKVFSSAYPLKYVTSGLFKSDAYDFGGLKHCREIAAPVASRLVKMPAGEERDGAIRLVAGLSPCKEVKNELRLEGRDFL